MTLEAKARRILDLIEPHKKFLYFFVDHPEANEIIDTAPELARAYLRLREALASCNCKDGKPVDIEERFNALHEKTDGCWKWIGSTNGRGYGQMSVRNRPKAAHRVSYELHKGPIGKGYQIDHLCRNRGCVNPEHLEAVSQRDNVLRGVGSGAINAKKTHCAKGHPYSGDNLIKTLSGQRKCRTCQSAYKKEKRQRARDALKEGE